MFIYINKCTRWWHTPGRAPGDNMGYWRWNLSQPHARLWLPSVQPLQPPTYRSYLSLCGENPNLNLHSINHYLTCWVGLAVRPWPWQIEVQLLMEEWGVSAHWNTLSKDPWLCSQMDVQEHSSVDKAEWRKKTHWKWICEKSPIPCMIMEGKKLSQCW